MSTPTQPTPEAILAAIETLSAVKDWQPLVGDLDGPDERLASMRALGAAAREMAFAVAEDIGAVAHDEHKQALRDDEPSTARVMFAQACHSGLQASQAWVYFEGLVKADEGYKALADRAAQVPESMTEEEHDQALERA